MHIKFTKTFTISVLAIGSLLYSGCKKDGDNSTFEKNPKACFSTYQNNIPSEVISFINCSENATSYHWDYGDGTESTSRNSEHIYQTLGPKTITLTAFGNNKENTYSQTINVNTIPPKAIKINKITITHWKDTFNNRPWDTDGFADLTPKITDNSRYLYLSTVVHNNCQIGTPYTFDSSSGLPLRLTEMDETVYIEWYDKDNGTSSQFIGSVGLTPSSRHTYGENKISFDQNEFQLELEVTWEY